MDENIQNALAIPVDRHAQGGPSVEEVMMSTLGTNPESHAQAVNLARRLDMSPALVATNPEWAKEQLTTSIDYEALRTNYPATAAYMQDKDRASVSRDDLVRNMAIEDSIRDGDLMEPGLFSGKVRDKLITEMRGKGHKVELSADPMGFFQRTAEGVKKAEFVPFAGAGVEGYEVYHLSQIAGRAKDGKLTDQDKLDLLKYDNEMRRGTTFGGKVAAVLTNLPAFAGEIALTGGLFTAGKTAARNAGLLVAKKLLNKSVREVAESAVLRSGVNLAGWAAGATLQGTVGMPHRVAVDTMQRMLPQMQFSVNERDELEAVVKDSNDGFASALGKAIVNQAIEVGTENAGAFIGKVTGLEALKSAVMTKWFKLNPTKGWSQFTSLLRKSKWDGVLEEFGEERLGELLRAATGLEDLKFNPEQYAVELVSFAALPLAGAAITGPKLVRQANTAAQRAQTQVEYLRNLGQEIEPSKTRMRVEGYLGYLGNLAAQDGPVKSVFVDVPAWNAHFESKGIDPREAAIDVLGSAAAYDAAQTNKHAFEIPLGNYVEKLAPTEHNEPMSRVIRFNSPTAQNVEELEQESKSLSEQVANMVSLNQDFTKLNEERTTLTQEQQALEQQLAQAQAQSQQSTARMQEIMQVMGTTDPAQILQAAQTPEMQSLVAEYQSLQEQSTQLQTMQSRLAEIETRQQEITQQLDLGQQAQEEAARKFPTQNPEITKHADKVFDELVATGNASEKVARVQANMFARMAFIMATRAGMTLQEFTDRFGVTIKGKGAAAPAGVTMSQEEQQRDADYLAAVDAGDMETAQRLVNEAAKAAGFDVTNEYFHTGQIGIGELNTEQPFYITPDASFTGLDSRNAKQKTYPLFAHKNLNIFDLTNSADAGKLPLNDSEKQAVEEVKKWYSDDGKWNSLSDSEFGNLTEQQRNEHDDAYSSGDYSIVESYEDEIRNLGYDAFYTRENGTRNIGVLNTSLVKSAEPVTRDSDGNVIPLSERFNTERTNILYQQRRDADYLAAVDAGDMETAQRLVNEAAKAAGYNYRVYRGVENDYLKGDGYVFKDADLTYFTSSKETAESYANWMGRNPDGVVYNAFLKLTNPWIPENINDATDWAYDAEKLMKEGYDGVVGLKDGKVQVAVAFNANQIKSADPVTRDANGNVIPLSERFDEKQNSILYQSAPSEDVLADAPTITLQDLVGRAVFPIIADLTSAGVMYTGIDSTQIAVPIYTQGGPKFPLLLENVLANVAWASQGTHIATSKAKLAGQSVLGIVVAMSQEAHKSNATVISAILATVQAYVEAGRMTNEQVAALDELIRVQGPIAEKKAMDEAQSDLAKAQSKLKKAKTEKDINAANKAIAEAQAKVEDANPGDKSLSKWPGFGDAQAASEFIDRNKTTFGQRQRLADVIALKEAQALGTPNVEAILNELRDKDYDNMEWGDSIMVIEFDKNDSLVRLGTDGTKEHLSYEWGIRGRVVGKLARPVNYTLIWDDFFKERRAQHSMFMEAARKEAKRLKKDFLNLTDEEFKKIKKTLEEKQELKPALEGGDRRSFELGKPVQVITQEIADRIPQTPHTAIKSPKHAQLVNAFINNKWMSTDVAVNAGGLGPAAFLNALAADPNKVLLDEYTLQSIKKAKKESGLRIFQLGEPRDMPGVKKENTSKVFFGLKNGDPASAYGLDPAAYGFGPNEKMLTLVLNGERKAPGMLTAIMIKALEEGATSLDCYAVPSKKHPNGFLPDLYKDYGFEVVGTIPFSEEYHSATKLADMKKLWKDSGWDESLGYPPIVLMKWKGTDEQRKGLRERYIREGTASVLAAGNPSPNAAAAVNIIDNVGAADGREGVRPDGGRVAGNEGPAVQPLEYPLKLAGAVAELRQLTPLELQNLGILSASQAEEAIRKAKEEAENQPVFPEITLNQTAVPAGMSAKQIADWAAEHSIEEVRQKLKSFRLTPTQTMLEMLGSFPEYLKPVVDFVMAQRQKLVDGNISAREVAKAYFITLSSIGADAINVETIRQKAAAIGMEFNPDPMFLSKGSKGQDRMRPEELAAWWFSTDMGQRALNAIEKGEVDREAWEQGLAIRDAFGRNDAREKRTKSGSYVPGMLGDKRKKKNLNDILEITKLINGTKGNSKKLEKVLNGIQGVGNGKKGFVGHMLGMGDVATIDAVEMNVWLTGKGDTTRADEEMKKRVALAKKGGTKVSDFYERIRARIAEIHKKTKSETGIPDEVAAHIVHHWIWDKAKGAETTHAGVYEAMRFYQRAFHGSPHKFEKFMLDHIGTGEGAQAYGWGLYFAGNREVAEYYRESLSRFAGSRFPRESSQSIVKRGLSKVFGSSRIFSADEENNFVYSAIGSVSRKDLQNPEASANRMARNLWTSVASLRDIPESKLAEAILAIRKEDNHGQLYEVEIPENDVLLDWDKPLSEQPKPVLSAIKRMKKHEVYGQGVKDALSEDMQAEDFYNYLAGDSIGAQYVSEALNEEGIKGIRYLDQASRNLTDGQGTHNFVIFDDTAIEMLRTFYQNENNARGSISFNPAQRGAPKREFTIRMLKKANASTFMHEAAHFYLEVFNDLASAPDAPQALREDWDRISKWLGLQAGVPITVDQHETFARGFERYLMEGKAPAEEVRGFFASMRTWLVRIYRDLMNLNVDISDDIRGVFDRMVATDAEIAAEESRQKVEPLFAEKPDGMNDQTWDRYLKQVENASRTARERMQAELEQEMLDAQTAQREAEEANIRAGVTGELHTSRDYIGLHVLRFGKMPDGSEIPSPLMPMKLDKDSLVAAGFDKDTMDKLRRLGVYRVEGGVSQDAAAQLLGFDSGDELVRTITSLEPIDEAIAAETKRRLDEKFPSLLEDPAKVRQAAADAVRNDKRDEVIALEMAALASLIAKDKKAFGRIADAAPAPLGAIARQVMRGTQLTADAAASLQDTGSKTQKVMRDLALAAVQGQLSVLKLRDIRPALYLSAAKAASTKAARASASGKYEEALAEKEAELVNHLLYRESRAMLKEAAKQRTYLDGMTKDSTRARIGLANPMYRDQIDQILERFNFKPVPLTLVDRRQRLADWITAQEAAGATVNIDPVVRDEAFLRDFRDMTGEELFAVYEAVKQIDHLAKLTNKLLTVQDKRKFAELVDELVAQMTANTKANPRKMGSKTPGEQTKEGWDSFFAAHRKLASLVREMDGFVDGGPLYWAIMDPINQAGNAEALETEKATVALKGLFDVFEKDELKRMTRKQVVRGATKNFNLSREDRLAIALNWGNEDNRQKLVDGYNGLTEQDVLAILDTLEKKDWDFVQSVWDYMDSFWPRIRDKQERIYGLAPEKVEAAPVITKFGVYAGGYYPLKYAGARAEGESDADAAKQMMRGAVTAATTKRGHTQARVEGVERPIRLELGVVTEHITQVIHDLTHHEMLIDVNRILRDQSIMGAIEDHYGEAVYRQLRKGLEAVAVGNTNSEDRFTRALGYIRTGVSVAGLGFNLMTSMLQAFGLTNAIPRVGVLNMAKAVGRWIGSSKDMEDSIAWIYKRSDMMRLRGKTMNRELNEIRNTIDPKMKTALMDSYFYLIQKGQMLADVPTWLGAYHKAREAGSTEPQAIALADQTVIDTQGGGMVKDLATVQRGGPLLKMWTTFYSYFNALWNMNVEAVKSTDFRSPTDIGRMMVDLLVLNSLPVAIQYALLTTLRGGGDDEEWYKELAKQQASYFLAQMVFVRELGGIFEGRSYEGPAGGRFFSEAYKLARQVEQGELDRGLWTSANKVGGILFHYPSTQLQRTVEGAKSLWEGKTSNPAVLIVGPSREQR